MIQSEHLFGNGYKLFARIPARDKSGSVFNGIKRLIDDNQGRKKTKKRDVNACS